MATAVGSYVTTALLKSRADIDDSADDTLLGLVADQVNQYVEGFTGRVVAPISGTPVRLYDFDYPSAVLCIPEGVRTIVTLEVAQHTDAAYETISASDYFLRPLSPQPAWPYTEVRLSDRPTGSYSRFPVGYETVRITGTFGWAAIPDDLAEVAVTIAVRAWHARENGQQDIVGTDEFGRPVVSRFVSGRDRDTLRRYALADSLA